MVLVDVNLLVYSVHLDDPAHEEAAAWLDGLLHQPGLVALPWQVVIGFVRVVTNPKILHHPLSTDRALEIVQGWLALPNVIALQPTETHLRHFAACCQAANATGNLVTDAHLAALAIEHGAELASNDTDFARFPGLRWFNPLADHS